MEFLNPTLCGFLKIKLVDKTQEKKKYTNEYNRGALVALPVGTDLDSKVASGYTTRRGSGHRQKTSAIKLKCSNHTTY